MPRRRQFWPHGGWPRLLDAREAGAYVGLSASAFIAAVGKRWPAPVSIGTKAKRWDIRDLDAAIDRIKRSGEHVSTGDPFLDGLHEAQGEARQ